MNFSKYPILFCTGGSAYMALELLWRGWTHGSMFVAGGTCFLLLGQLRRKKPPLPLQAFLGAGIITAVELTAGMLVNRDYQVWDYRCMPLSFRGQICLPYCLLWVPVGMAAMALYEALDQKLSCPTHKGRRCRCGSLAGAYADRR